jgi:hypothetical protein
MKCQTWLRGALMTALSTTEVEVGIAVEDMFADVVLLVYVVGK